MAKYHKNLKYYEDTIEKHALTEEEIIFLLALQKEMNTQDNVSQADPRFWVINGAEKEYGIETGYEDGSDLMDAEGYDIVATDLESVAVYIEKELLDDINDRDGIKRNISLVSGIFHPSIRISWNDAGFDDYIDFDSMEGVAEWLNDQGYDFKVANYRIVEKIYPDTMFLTQKAAEDHLKANGHHYSEDAHTYAMTAWRSPETEKLWRILQQVDWRALLPNLQSGLEHADQQALASGA